MSEQMYLVGSLTTSRQIEIMTLVRDIDLKWADGMVGVMPVFKDRESALKYSDDKTPLYVIEAKESE